MPETKRFYRLRIRDAADAADALVITSVRGGTNPYLLKAPHGEGNSFDPLTGEVRSGSYTCQVVDAETAANTRVVTAQLADANARQQLLSRRAYVEDSEDGAAWSQMIAGYVTAARLVTALVFEIGIGETRRVEITRDIFKTATSRFDRMTCWMGGPVRGGFGPMRDYGGWHVKVAATSAAPKYVRLSLQQCFNPRNYTGHHPTIGPGQAREIFELTRPFYRRSATWESVRIFGHFPGLKYRLETTGGAHVGTYAPVARPREQGVFDWLTPEDRILKVGEGLFWVNWTDALPAVGTQYRLYLYADDIGKSNPLHVLEHPVDLLEKLWLDAGEAYDAAVLPAVKAILGNDLRLALRITESGKLGEWCAKHIYGPFGLATRRNGAGQIVLFSTRIKSAAAPASTITVNDLRNASGTVFDLDESTVANKVTWKQKRMAKWDPEDGDSTPPPDGIVEVDQSYSVENDPADVTAFGDREVVYEIPGYVRTAQAEEGFNIEDYVTGIGREVFDRYGRGAIGGAIHCLRGIDAQIGEERILNIPQLPNAVVGAAPVSQRGGNRIVQIIERTDTPSGPDYRVLDSGTSAQPATLPTFTIVVNAASPRKFADIAITNAGALAAEGSKVRIEWATGAGAPAQGALLTVLDPAAVSSIITPAVNAGEKVWARMRAEIAGKRPSAWTAFAGAQLTALTAPAHMWSVPAPMQTVAEAAALTMAEAGACSGYGPYDPSILPMRWRAAAADVPVDVLRDAEVLAVLPPGSTDFSFEGLTPGQAYTLGVRSREAPPFSGTSATTTNGKTPSNVAYKPPRPLDVTPWAESPGPSLASGAFGVDLTPQVADAFTEIEIAIETSPNSGVAGAYQLADTIRNEPGQRTRWTSPFPARNDGLKRFVRARTVRVGGTPSDYSTPVSIRPWLPQGAELRARVALFMVWRGELVHEFYAVSSFPGRLAIERVNPSLTVTELASGPDVRTLRTVYDNFGLPACNVRAKFTDPKTGEVTYTSPFGVSDTISGIAPAAVITDLVLSGAASAAKTAARDREALVATVTHTGTVAGNYVFLRFSLDGETFTATSAAYSAPVSASPQAISFPLAWLAFGDLFVMAEIRQTSAVGSYLYSEYIVLGTTGYRGY